MKTTYFRYTFAQYAACFLSSTLQRKIAPYFLCLSILLLSACGGGGGGSEPATFSPPPPNSAPNAVISASSLSVLFSDSVTLDSGDSSDSDGSITSYAWDVNGQAFSGATITIQPTNGQDLNVTLTVTDNDGSAATDTVTIEVQPNQVAAVTFEINNGFRVGKELPFSIIANAEDPDSTIVSYQWDMGDDTEYSGSNEVIHTYSSVEERVVTLVLKDDFGVTSSHTITINVDFNQPASPRITGNSLLRVSEEVRFSASQSTSLTGEIVSYNWDFGDASVGQGENVTHTYTTPGEYTVTLTVVDDFNVAQEATLNAVVANANQTPFRINVDADRALVTTDQVVTFFAQVRANESVTISNYLWQISGGIPSASTATNEYSYQFEEAGEYIVEVKAFGEDGFEAISSETITIADAANTQSLSLDLKLRNGVYIDTDTNSPDAIYTENNNFPTAQIIPPTSNVVGFVTQTSTGTPGDVFEAFPDEFDVFATELRAGQRVFLSRDQEEDSTSDLDLGLFNSDGELVEISASATNSEVVIAPVDGIYFIAVQAFSGMSTYELVINFQGVQSSTASTTMDFVPGDIIVSSPIESGKSIKDASRKRAEALSSIGVEGSNNDDSTFMQLLKSPAAMSLNKSASRISSNETSTTSFNGLKGMTMSPEQAAKLRTLIDIKAIQAKGLYKFVEPNFILKKTAVTNDPRNELTWHYKNIRLNEAWDITTGNIDNPVIVAVADTGVLSDHPDLSPNLVSGYDFISDPLRSNDGDGIDPDPYDSGDAVEQRPNSYHGSHVGSTIAAATNNGIGLAGAGYNVKHMPIRVLGKNGGTIFDIYSGIRYAAGLPNPSGSVPSRPADVINMSLSGVNYSLVAQLTINEVTSRGVIIIAAAGNSSTSQPAYPASYDNVISVSATDINNEIAYYSNFGAFIDIAAPGGDNRVDQNNDGFPDGVLGATKDDNTGTFTYKFEQGTSMAAPHVAGVAALMKSVRPQLTSAEFELLLEAGFLTRDIGDLDRDSLYGYGLLDAEKAVIAARDFDNLRFANSTVDISVNRLVLSSSQSAGQFSVNITGFTPLSITDITFSGNFFTVNAINTREDGSGIFEVRLNSDVVAGSYTGSIMLTDSNGETYDIAVTAEVVEITVEQNGYVYALIIDAFTQDVIKQLDGEFNPDGTLTLSALDVPVGEYYILVGSDIDNDFFICDGGEVCGGYPTLNDLEPIVINEEALDGLPILIDAQALLSVESSASFVNKSKGQFFLMRK
ncbi:S8 family serine peptidase [Brumicola nitratireducens]|uniref:Peptidase S8 and S53, subtilisin, kexin, sedolisin n=1 Tax=Glaciecola nitratireducens (strain JCM 12485 / KCTC 12276 / FR1064) TaxID=1085623 RepID=G4QH84_GLANF|nr:S8 family serine peptidase [Glaciecola nitratireducens]AEP29715.1 peptidase S8 and S53, subtilisin, kexin, sedolisin [Glaciecola nitratireducens FR1064]